MAIKASTTITISKYRDTDSVTRYYKLQASTAAAPAKPTTLEPSGWTTSEPSYTSGSTNTLYFCDRSKFSDGTFSYSDVSKSSSYEAAKAAYNKAQNAQDSVDNMEIGGRNLLLNTKTFEGSNISAIATLDEETYKDLSVRTYDNSTSTSGFKDLISFLKIYPNKLGETYRLSFYAKGSGAQKLITYFHGVSGYLPVASVKTSTGYKGSSSDGNSPWTLTDEWERYWVEWTLKSTGDITKEKIVLFRLYYGGTASICGVKLEIGNKATDWTPAPEDAENDIQKAQDTAGDAYNKANEAANNANVAKTEINSLKATITDFVKDDKGYVKVVTTPEGLRIDMSTVTEKIDETIKELSKKVNDETYNAALKELSDQLKDTTERTAYINAGTDDKTGQPVILLGTNGDTSPFKLKITNTAIEFIKGVNGKEEILASVNGDAFFSKKSIATTEIQIGPMTDSSHDAFAWQIRASGNFGLVYKQV